MIERHIEIFPVQREERPFFCQKHVDPSPGSAADDPCFHFPGRRGQDTNSVYAKRQVIETAKLNEYDCEALVQLFEPMRLLKKRLCGKIGYRPLGAHSPMPLNSPLNFFADSFLSSFLIHREAARSLGLFPVLPGIAADVYPCSAATRRRGCRGSVRRSGTGG